MTTAPSSSPPTRAETPAGPRNFWAVETWKDANKVLAISLLTLPFALAWLLRTYQLQADLTLAPYANREFFPVHIPFLWVQVVGHVLLVLAALVLRRQAAHHAGWLVHAEIQFWFLCMSYSLYAVGPFTSPFGTLVLALPIIGYQVFDERHMHLGLVTFLTGATVGAVLPQMGVLPYAPFLAHPPFDNGRLQGGWIVSLGLPTIFATAVVLVIHVFMMRRLRERQAELERLSSTDVLTGLCNRSVFYRRLNEEVARSRRHGHPVSVVMLDVDHFKRINDTHGHLTGDDVLRRLARAIQDGVRLDDVAARYGGEEFSIVLPHTSLQDSAVVAQRLQQLARNVMIKGAGDGFITVSLGVAELWPQDRPDDLLARADAALYQSKRNGRDRVTYASAQEVMVEEPAQARAG